MTTETSPLNRQPSKLDYSSPTQFRFLINQLPKVQYFTVAANIPGLSLNETSYATPLKDIPLIGEKLNYEDLTITFIVDENLENYIELHNWITSLGFPKDRSQFKSFRETTANTKVTSSLIANGAVTGLDFSKAACACICAITATICASADFALIKTFAISTA